MDFFVLSAAFFLAFFLALLNTIAVKKLYFKRGWLDNPKKKAHPKIIHLYPVPRGGGLAVLFPIVLTSLIFLPLDKHLTGIILGLMVLGLTGFLDDLFDLNPYLRLFLGFLACLCVVGVGIGIPFVTNPFGGIIRLDQPQLTIFLLGETKHLWLLADIFAVIWLLACMNFVNWAKGVDGQLPGIVVVAALTIAVASFRYSADITQWPVAILAVVTAGAYLGFLPFNVYPQKIMPGYGGGTIAGFMLAVLSLLATTKVGTTIMVLSIPLIDAFLAIVRRIASGRSPVWGDAAHFHHRLLVLGWSKRKIALFYWLITAILGFLAIYLSSLGKFYTIILLFLILTGFFLWTRSLKLSGFQPGRNNGLKT